MKELLQTLQMAGDLVKELQQQINRDNINFKEAEQEVLKYVNKLGHLLCQEVVEGIKEPFIENHVIVEGQEACFRDLQTLSFIDRFGQKLEKQRRVYKFKTGGGYYPLDEKLGFDKCGGFSPLMSFLLSFYGGSGAYAEAAKKLSLTLGFPVSATGVQKNTERTGKKLEADPFKIIPSAKQNEEADRMIVEIDGTMSPRITEQAGLRGRESLKQPTEYKECNIISIQKFQGEEQIANWVGAMYGKRSLFELYVHKTGICMGQLKAKEVVFIADGAKHNWEIQLNNFSNATPILDFFHATEHLAEFCSYLPQAKDHKKQYQAWYQMLYEGEILQFLYEARKALLEKITDKHNAVKHYSYFKKNQEKMHYDLYKAKGYPIGSGLVEGNCKLLVGKRFKGNGMRWKKADNEAVLKVRLAIFNNQLDDFFTPTPKKYIFATSAAWLSRDVARRRIPTRWRKVGLQKKSQLLR